MKKYFRHRLEHLVEVSRVITIHHFEFDQHFCTAGESHDFWELVYADREEILCTADGRSIPLRAGEMLFHKPLEFHTLAANGKKAPTVLIVSFECKSPAMGFFAERKICPKQRDVRFLYALVDEAKRTFNIPVSDPESKKMELLPSPTLGGQQLIKNYLEILLINLMRDLTETGEGNDTFLQSGQWENKLVGDIVRILEENVEGSLSIDQLCRRIAYGRAWAFREFKKGTGESIMSYYTRLKIARAKQLLREGETSVSQIAEILCFDTPSYFSKTFKRITGQTPSAYQKMKRKP